MEYCRKHAASCFFHDKFIGVSTPYSKWRIIPIDGSQRLALYHGNTFETKNDDKSLVPQYHLQKVRKNTILDYLEYIVEHENYRMMNPVYIRREQKAPPTKGTKRYKKQQKKAERYARKQSIIKVLNMIDSLSVYSQAAALRA